MQIGIHKNKIKRFYSSQKEFRDICLGLKQSLCPHCNVAGFLIKHDILKRSGEKDIDDNNKQKCGQRMFCSNRNNRKGCGRTVPVLVSNMMNHLRISADSLWRFLKKAAEGVNKTRIFKTLGLSFCVSTAYRLWDRFRKHISRIRTSLLKIGNPPLASHSSSPAVETVLHLEHVLKYSSSPVAAFQERFQTAFL